jgi:hypothetical protein
MGMLNYFPQACYVVAHISFLGNQKHAPGMPLQWVRGKSNDQTDCIARHLIDAYQVTGKEKIIELGSLAWRAMAELQLEIERQGGLAAIFESEGEQK